MGFKNAFKLLISLWVFAWAKGGALDFAIAKKAFEDENYPKALEYYLKAGEGGYAEGYRMAGYLYLGSLKGVEQDVPKALTYLKRAGEMGSADAYHRLGGMYEWGTLVSQDAQKALDYYQKAGQLGRVDAYLQLGEMYEHALGGVAQDGQKALEYYEKAAQVGKDAYTAYERIADMYIKGKCVPRDEQKALEYYQKAYGKADGYVFLGDAYSTDSYEDKDFPIDLKKSIYYYQQGAKLGSPRAHAALAEAYEDGNERVPRDLKKALKHSQQACAFDREEFYDNCNDANRLKFSIQAEVYEYGRGVTKDLKKALYYYQKACKIDWRWAEDCAKAEHLKQTIILTLKPSIKGVQIWLM
ncbi:SEL1-like repeat protein [Helicobacter labacensis]|uniref:SEL1-like repeat protein n=1 Tax=Helicobacter labacensis TaxID=2316079 RepID=UPI000EB0B237|nr:SEL1-like repeat protein [Helicobacter labacensis]